MSAEPKSPEAGEVTRLLNAMGAGDPAALDRVLPLVHAELRAAAARLLRREPVGHTLQPTDLLHEAWLRLAGNAPSDLTGRKHFVAVAARLMRQVLVDHARRRLAAKRGAGVAPVSLSQVALAPPLPPEELIALDDALDGLHALSPRLRQVVEYRFFAGLDEREIASLLDVTPRTVQRDWARARAWLHQALDPAGEGVGDS
jgi:RNA polymerase sigma factor (TIGR02999 family)